MKWLFFVVSLIFTATPNKTWASFEDGFAAAKSGNFLKAYSVFFDGAQKGDIKAQTALGLMYLGIVDGLLADKGKAAERFRKAAEQGEREAQYQLGEMYRLGSKALKKNNSLALEWHKKAAEQGDPFAQTSVGSLYYLGNLPTEANKW
jgi:TPR repeat protein